MEIDADGIAPCLVDLAKHAAQRYLATTGQSGRTARLKVKLNLAYLHVGDQIVGLQYSPSK